jgi:hypothetical protein
MQNLILNEADSAYNKNSWKQGLSLADHKWRLAKDAIILRLIDVRRHRICMQSFDYMLVTELGNSVFIEEWSDGINAERIKHLLHLARTLRKLHNSIGWMCVSHDTGQKLITEELEVAFDS